MTFLVAAVMFLLAHLPSSHRSDRGMSRCKMEDRYSGTSQLVHAQRKRLTGRIDSPCCCALSSMLLGEDDNGNGKDNNNDKHQESHSTMISSLIRGGSQRAAVRSCAKGAVRRTKTRVLSLSTRSRHPHHRKVFKNENTAWGRDRESSSTATKKTTSTGLRSTVEDCVDVEVADDKPTYETSIVHRRGRWVLPPRLDLTICMIYGFHMVALTIPVVLAPVVAAELTPSVAPFLASMAVFGGAVGKFVNGFVCRRLGAVRALQLYGLGLALGSFVFSASFLPPMFSLFHPFSSPWSTLVAWGIMEFFGSILWTACMMLLSELYDDESRRSNAVGRMGMTSTVSNLLTKVVGSLLLTWGGWGWRALARTGALLSLMGVALVATVVAKDVAVDKDVAHSNKRSNQMMGMTKKTAALSPPAVRVRDILGSSLFWKVGLAHATAFLVRTSDRVLGAFYLDVTGLPRSICGGLTFSSTLGFAVGAATGAPKEWKNRYASSVLASVALAACAVLLKGGGGVGLLGGWTGASAVALASFVMAAAVSAQFYRLPSRFAVSPSFISSSSSSFNGNIAASPPTEVCLSWLDGLGYAACIPVWSAVMSRPNDGWVATWIGLAVCLGLGGVLMGQAITEVGQKEDEDRDKAFAKQRMNTKLWGL